MPETPLKKPLLHRISLWCLAGVSLFWLVFAFLSGAQEAGGGLAGLIRNSPNALPWLLPLVLLWLARRHPVAAGLGFVLLGALSVLQFETYRHGFTFAPISAPYLGFGALLAFSAWRSG